MQSEQVLVLSGTVYLQERALSLILKILGLKSGPLLSMINLSKGRDTQTYEKQMCPHSTVYVMFMLTGVKLYVI